MTAVEKAVIRAPFAFGELTSHQYRPWLDENDKNDLLFASTHGLRQWNSFVLEGGYKQVHGGIVSPFAGSVASHVCGLFDGGRSRELYDVSDLYWESQFEVHKY